MDLFLLLLHIPVALQLAIPLLRHTQVGSR